MFIGEMKCWLEYQNYRFLTLDKPEQLSAAEDVTFRFFLNAAKEPARFAVSVNGEPLSSIYGSILVWGRCSEEGRKRVVAALGLEDVLSLEEIIGDLLNWQNQEYLELLNNRKAWAERLFTELTIPDACVCLAAGAAG